MPSAYSYVDEFVIIPQILYTFVPVQVLFYRVYLEIYQIIFYPYITNKRYALFPTNSSIPSIMTALAAFNSDWSRAAK